MSVSSRSKAKSSSLRLNSFSFCFCVNLLKLGITTITISSATASLASLSSPKTLAIRCRSITSSSKSKNLVNFSFACDFPLFSFGSSLMACINGEKFVSKYAALAVRQLELMVSIVGWEIRGPRSGWSGCNMRWRRKYEMLLRRNIEPKAGRRKREMALRLLITFVTTSSTDDQSVSLCKEKNGVIYTGSGPG